MAVCTPVLPSFNADYCVAGVNFGKINKIFFTRVGDGLTDSTDLEEWDTRLSNTDVAPVSGAYPIRFLNVIGSMPPPEQAEVPISLNRTVYGKPKFNVPFKVDDTGDVNYNAVGQLQLTGGGIYTAWFETDSGHLFGGDTGFVVSLSLRFNLPESNGDVQTIEGNLKWEGQLPTRSASPFV